MDQLMPLLGLADLDHLNLSSPQSWSFVIMLLIAMFYGIMLNLLYSVYFRENEPVDPSLARSLVLLTPTLMTVFWLIQFSLPLSVGLLGTLSFVRFRYPVKRAEDIAFIVIALACAITCAIMKPILGGSLILLFLCYSFVRNFFFGEAAYHRHFAVVTYNTKKNPKVPDLESAFLKAECKNFECVSSRTYDGITSFVFNITHLSQSNISLLTKALEQFDQESQINVFYPNGRLGV